MDRILTIGGYGHSKESFFNLLQHNKVDLFVDIRQRRGVRGSKYSFLNSTSLQNELKKLNINYLYIKELAPTSSIRFQQKSDDATNRVTKKQRIKLSENFKTLYKKEILQEVSIIDILDMIKSSKNPCFFCVEECASACHRSLVSNWISQVTGLTIENIGLE